MKNLSVFAIFLIYISSCQSSGLKLTLYYESLCPSCKDFITNQLYPAHQLLGDAFEIELIPFGFTKLEKLENGHWKFICQNGSEECRENKYHACAVAMNPIEASLEFVYCIKSVDGNASEERLSQCSDQSGINFDTLRNCYSSSQTDEFLVQYGIITLAAVPRIRSIPAISFNDKFDQKLSNEAQKNLVGVICRHLEVKPDSCSF